MKVWPVADGLPTIVVIHQLHVERGTGKVRRPETDVLPLCHATTESPMLGNINKSNKVIVLLAEAVDGTDCARELLQMVPGHIWVRLERLTGSRPASPGMGREQRPRWVELQCRARASMTRLWRNSVLQRLVQSE